VNIPPFGKVEPNLSTLSTFEKGGAKEPDFFKVTPNLSIFPKGFCEATAKNPPFLKVD
jgi:hypothetical protein